MNISAIQSELRKVSLSNEINDVRYDFETMVKGHTINCSIVPNYAGAVMIFVFKSIIFGRYKKESLNISTALYEQEYNQTPEDYKRACTTLLDEVIQDRVKKNPSLFRTVSQYNLFEC